MSGRVRRLIYRWPWLGGRGAGRHSEPDWVRPPVRRPETRSEVETIASSPRAVVYLSVEWSGPERISRKAFAELAGRLGTDYPGVGATLWVVNETTDGAHDWFRTAELPFQAGAGYGAVVWLELGQVVTIEADAGRAGSDALISRTLELWGKPGPTKNVTGHL